MNTKKKQQQKVYDVDYFIRKFKRIPERCWTTGTYFDGVDKCCALGHCGARRMEWTVLANTLSNMFNGNAHSINDGQNPFYNQSTPRKRILAALTDIKRKQQKQNTDETNSNSI